MPIEFISFVMGLMTSAGLIYYVTTKLDQQPFLERLSLSCLAAAILINLWASLDPYSPHTYIPNLMARTSLLGFVSVRIWSIHHRKLAKERAAKAAPSPI